MATLFRLPFDPFGLAGVLLSNGTVTFYQTGTSILDTVYTDNALSVPATNPAPLDGAGQFTQGKIFLANRDYRVVVKTAGGSTIPNGDVDPVHGGSSVSSFNNITLTGTTSFPGSGQITSNGYISVGGDPATNAGVDSTIGLGVISTAANNIILSATHYGATGGPTLHFHRSRGTAGIPTVPQSGDNLMSIGCRAYYNGTFGGSSLAIQGILSENVTGTYSGSYLTFETTPNGGARTEVLRVANVINTNGIVSATHKIASSAAENANNIIFNVQGITENSIQVVAVSGTGDNAAACALRVRKDTGTNRSINAAGTVNASGADYAEYETKADGCGDIAKGQIIGFDRNGDVTDKWADAFSFGTKSTDPSYVGGDSWAPLQIREEPVCPDAPRLGRGDDPEAPAYLAARAAHDLRVEQYDSDHAQWLADRVKLAADIEKARTKVDRIAYSGKVPCNVIGATVGDYIIAVADGDGIAGKPVPDPTFAQYQNAVGRVRKILPDGRCSVAVMVH